MWPSRMYGLGKLLTSLPLEESRIFQECLMYGIETAKMELLAAAGKGKLRLPLSGICLQTQAGEGNCLKSWLISEKIHLIIC